MDPRKTESRRVDEAQPALWRPFSRGAKAKAPLALPMILQGVTSEVAD
jgi:hypothetical protein